MDIKRVKLIYFSPTGTTQKVLDSIAQGIGAQVVERFNLTLPEGASQTIPPLSDELVILGAPVYGGRLPAEAIKRFRQIKAENTLAVPVVLYGNREFEDSLLELKNLAIELGCKPVAAGAFIGEHSFATEALPIAMGRPDDDDLAKAQEFGAKIKNKIEVLESPAVQEDLDIPGRFPYEGGVAAMAVSPVSKEDLCILCGTCASVCPTAAVTVDESVATEVELCIRCSACVKNCPTGARVWEAPAMAKVTNWLHENCAARKEPQVFGVG
ncbi:MAG: 4Fe-4S binding protein [Deltaproteobacteria bacterium]|nr:4Fe-4S binding protein [Deltaproteobacteria bacterium]